MTFCIDEISDTCNDHVLVRDAVTFSFKENRLIAARIRDGSKLLNRVNYAGVAGIMIIPYQQVTVGKRVIVRFSQIRIDSECPVSVIEVRCDLDTACDYFFDQKNKATSSQRSVEIENMEKKKALIEKLASIDENMDTDEASTLVRELMKEWNTIGHVPFKEKDKLYKQYHGLIDQLFDRFNISASNKKLSNFRSNISNIQGGGSQSLYREREKLVRIYENMKNELQTYENNLGFLTSSSKKGSSLLTELNRKVDKLKADLELVLQKIKVIDESLKAEE